MEWATSEIVATIYALLPGFLAAWVFSGLTAHPKREPFDRIIQALIFTAICQSLTWAALLIRRSLVETPESTLSHPTNESLLAANVVVALIVGVAFSYCANHDLVHRVLRSAKATPRTSFPSEWFSAFKRHQNYVTLYLKDQRRIYGWPDEWPDYADSGHFVLAEPEWLLDNGKRAPLLSASCFLIPSSQVLFVEFHPNAQDQGPISELETKVERELLDAQVEEKQHDRQSTSAKPESPNQA